MKLPKLNEGEHYAGLILNDEGTPSHHLVLLPGDNDDATWQAAVDWAKSIGGELPSRREQSLLYANLKPQFQSDWYWSGEQHASVPQFAWFQLFSTGSQYGLLISGTCRARAVRRVLIEGE